MLGAGGMGEVFSANDTTIDRLVALKVLPTALAEDADRLARFEREARTLAALNHPNIAALYGLERADGYTALVMELVDGPTLAERIARGALAADEALAIATQIADALECAHEHGIVHRDLKPANIKLRPDGTVKVLDFGLAKGLNAAVIGSGDLAAGLTPASSIPPTITSPAMTQVGVILGTAAYMSPEQARGKPVDKRTDIWAFGCVLYEMLTGVRPFDGEDIAEALGAVIHKEIAWNRLPANTPERVRAALRGCLRKDPKQRFRDIGDVRLALEGAFAADAEDSRRAPSHAASSRRAIALTVAVALIAAALGGAAAWIAHAPSPAEPIVFSVDASGTSDPASFTVSPDGRQLAYTQIDGDVQKLWIRPLGSPTAHAIAGTDNAANPFWSPDSRKVAFFANNTLKVVDLSGGAPQVITRTATTISQGGTWNRDGTILFARAAGGIFRVSASGGEAKPVTTLSETHTTHAWPMFLPDGRHFLYVSVAAAERVDVVDRGAGELVWRDLDTSEQHVVRKTFSKVWYSPTGHLVFRLDGPVVAQRFNPATGAISGDAFQIAPNVWSSGSGPSRTALALSPAGVLAYRAGEANAAVAQMSWMDRDGRIVGTLGPAGDYRNLMLDPSGDHATANSTVDSEDVWTFDVQRGTTSRLTFDPSTDSDPVFSPDGRTIAFYSTRNPPGIYRKPASGAGAEELVAATGLQSWPRDWSRDGRFLLYQKVADLWILPMDGDRKPFPYLATPARESEGAFSPDGHWIAYTSDETGRSEVFVQDFPAKGAKFQISTGGGAEGRWRQDGRELVYLSADSRLMSVSIDRSPEFRLGLPKPLFETALSSLALAPQRRFAVSADGQRFLMNVRIGGSSLPPITLWVNWQSALRGH